MKQEWTGHTNGLLLGKILEEETLIKLAYAFSHHCDQEAATFCLFLVVVAHKFAI